MNFSIAHNSIVEDTVSIGDGTKIWYFCHIREKAKIGRDCSIGDNCFIDKGVIIGDKVRIGNKVSLYNGVIIKDNVFIGNGATFTNVRKPKSGKKGKVLNTIIEEGASIGANSTIVAGVTIGKGASVAEGAIVYYDVPEGAFVASNVAHSKKLRMFKDLHDNI
jgi:UDP-2-acetamido-3-amino-2,3-dideoxy-glucuronate N-acetyltransferase